MRWINASLYRFYGVGFTIIIVLSTLWIHQPTSIVSADTTLDQSLDTIEYALPCRITNAGNWNTVRQRLGLSNDQALLDEINIHGRMAHGYPAIDLSSNTANPSSSHRYRNYGICDNRDVLVARRGRVVQNNWNSCEGWRVLIDHGDGHYSKYIHLDAKSPLEVRSESYDQGVFLGIMGVPASAGCGSGIHLHFSIDRSGGGTWDNWMFKNPIGIPNQPPRAPNPVAPANESSTQNAVITLSWHDTGDPDTRPYPFRKYFVEIWKTDNTWRTTTGDWIDATSWTVTVPQNGTYKWQVKAGDGEDDSPWSPAWHVTYRGINQPPRAPNPVAPTNESSIQNAVITLSWHDTGDPDNYPHPFRKYFVEIWKTDNTWRTTTGDWIDATSWTVTVPQNGTYKWQVKAGDGEDDSPWSPAWHVTWAKRYLTYVPLLIR